MIRIQIGQSGLGFRQGQEIFLFSVEFRLDLEPIQPLEQCVPGAFSPGAKRQGHSAEVKQLQTYFHSPVYLHGVLLSA